MAKSLTARELTVGVLKDIAERYEYGNPAKMSFSDTADVNVVRVAIEHGSRRDQYDARIDPESLQSKHTSSYSHHTARVEFIPVDQARRASKKDRLAVTISGTSRDGSEKGIYGDGPRDALKWMLWSGETKQEKAVRLDALRRELTADSLKSAAKSYEGLDIQIASADAKKPLRVVVDQGDVHREYDVRVAKPGLLARATSIASMGYFVKRAQVEITPVEDGQPVVGERRTMNFGIVNSDSGMSVYDDASKKALRWMLNRGETQEQEVAKKDAALQAFAIDNFKDAAKSMSSAHGKPDFSLSSSFAPAPIKIVVGVGAVQGEYEVEVKKPGLMLQAANIARMGYFVDVARVEVVPLDGGQRNDGEKQTFRLGVVNSESGMSVYSGGAGKALKWMQKRLEPTGKGIGF